VNQGEVSVWRLPLDDLPEERLPAPTPGETARASRLRSEELKSRYLRAHRGLRAILRRHVEGPLEFAVTEKGKPYLPGTPRLKFNLAHSRGMALVAVALDVEVGVDVECVRELPECEAIGERYLPPAEWAALAATPEAGREREFFRRWTRMEAMLKALGVGLYGAGRDLVGEWTLEEVDAGEGFAAAVAAVRPGMTIALWEF
jgi:4'-phosphopantetheinyl transferase